MRKRQAIIGAVIGGVFLTLLGYFLVHKTHPANPIQSGTISGAQSETLLLSPWTLNGSKTLSEASADIPVGAMDGKNALKVTYDLEGICALDGISSAISLVQHESSKKASVSLSDYGKNCQAGEQTVEIPLAHFRDIDWSKPVDEITGTFWYPTQYTIKITQIVAFNSGNILGISNEDKKKEHKTFPDITPIRPFPYVKRNSQIAP
jgi:hypothetical protein